MRLRIGTRASALALAQTSMVADSLREARPGLEVEVVRITTSGDRIRDVPLAEVGGKGLFVKEIESALLSGEIDCAVHSMKDVPGVLPAGLTIGAVPLREDPRDAVITTATGSWGGSRAGMSVGTCSPRRAAFLRRFDPELTIVPLRGNVGTRLAKVESGEVDATLLAVSGLRRLGITPANLEYLDPDVFVPAVGQGALAIECREGERGHRADVVELLASIEDPVSRVRANAERAFLAGMGGNCVTPIAALATVDGSTVRMTAVFADPSGETPLREEGVAPQADAAKMGAALADLVLATGGAELLRQLGDHS